VVTILKDAFSTFPRRFGHGTMFRTESLGVRSLTDSLSEQTSLLSQRVVNFDCLLAGALGCALRGGALYVTRR
jgi:hypothetical protein